MMYRARITRIQSWIENHYNTNMYHLVKDAKDVYIEVRDEDEAEQLELMNKKQEELLKLQYDWYEKYANEE